MRLEPFRTITIGYSIKNNAVAIEDTSTRLRDPCFNMIFSRDQLSLLFPHAGEISMVQPRDVVPAKFPPEHS